MVHLSLWWGWGGFDGRIVTLTKVQTKIFPPHWRASKWACLSNFCYLPQATKVNQVFEQVLVWRLNTRLGCTEVCVLCVSERVLRCPSGLSDLINCRLHAALKSCDWLSPDCHSASIIYWFKWDKNVHVDINDSEKRDNGAPTNWGVCLTLPWQRL